MREVMPTRAAALELADERKLMRQGHELLDETRMLLAGEMLRQLQSYEAGVDAMLAQLHAASAALADGIERHGLDMLQVYPAASPPQAPGSTRTGFLGVALRSAQAVDSLPSDAGPALDPSPEAEACRAAFSLLLQSVAIAGTHAANLHRLGREYRRTERCAKALENVLMPEVEAALAHVNEQLEITDREDIIRARRWAHDPASGI